MENILVPQPVVELYLNGENVHQWVSPYLLSLTYTDHAHTISDELEFTLADKDHRFKDSWFTDLATSAGAKIGYAGGALLDCGEFQIEEVEFRGDGGDSGGDTVTVRCVGVPLTPTLRTKKSSGFDGKTLEAIVREVAERHGLTVKGEFKKIEIDRSTQNHEKDLEYLERLAKSYGYAFNIKGGVLYFYDMEELENSKAQLVLSRKQLTNFTFQYKYLNTYQEAEVSHHKHSKKKPVKGKAKAEDLGYTKPHTNKNGVKVNLPNPPVKDTMVAHVRAHDEETAKIRARAKLLMKNREQLSGTVMMYGDPRLQSGITVEMVDLGGIGHPYFIDTASHRFTRPGGYVTELTLKRPSDLSKAESDAAKLTTTQKWEIKYGGTRSLGPILTTPGPVSIDSTNELARLGVTPYVGPEGQVFNLVK